MEINLPQPFADSDLASGQTSKLNKEPVSMMVFDKAGFDKTVSDNGSENRLTLVSHQLCPYVQRAAISLTEKGAAFERVTIDLANKPDWFLEISPLGKVPLLLVQQGARRDVIFESAVILAYLEETLPVPLLADDPLVRAQQRGWIEVGTSLLNGIGAFYSAQTEKELLDRANTLEVLWGRVETAMAQQESVGPWFWGSDFSLVDAVYGPVFRYFDTFDRIADFGMLSNKPRLEAWRQALAKRPSNRQAVGSDYDDRLWDFLKKKSSALSRKMR